MSRLRRGRLLRAVVDAVAKAVAIFFVVFNLVPIALLADRKVLGRFQHRYGPNRVGPFGALQPIADIGKLVFKEQFRPKAANGWLFALAPIISMMTAAATIAIIRSRTSSTSSARRRASTASIRRSGSSTPSPSAASPSTA